MLVVTKIHLFVQSSAPCKALFEYMLKWECWEWQEFFFKRDRFQFQNVSILLLLLLKVFLIYIQHIHNN